jgi:hypothetical protein
MDTETKTPRRPPTPFSSRQSFGLCNENVNDPQNTFASFQNEAIQREKIQVNGKMYLYLTVERDDGTQVNQYLMGEQTPIKIFIVLPAE